MEAGAYFISSPFSGNYMRMADQFKGTLPADKEVPLQLRSLYSLPNFQFVIPEPALRGVFDFVKADPSSQNVPNVLQILSNAALKNEILKKKVKKPSESMILA